MKNDEKKESVEFLVETYVKLEAFILDRIANLPHYGNDCGCGVEDRTTFSHILDEGEWQEIETLCIKCGGFVQPLGGKKHGGEMD